MKTGSGKIELNNAKIFILLLLRFGALLFAALLIIKTKVWSYQYGDIILPGFAIYNILAACAYWPVMKSNVTRLLLCVSDLLIAHGVILFTGGVNSPFILCLLVPIFTLHYIYGWKGLAGGVAGLMPGTVIGLLYDSKFLNTGNQDRSVQFVILALTLTIFYIMPFLFFTQYSQMESKLQSLKEKYNDMDNMNSKLLVLYEMTGRFNYEDGIAHIMDKLLALCRDIFPAQSACVFLIRSGEVEVYGKPTVQEKEDIYRLIMEQKKNSSIKEESEYIVREDALVIPLIRGARTDGVLSFKGWKQREITGREAILLSMMANMVCTYLENLEYVDSLKNKLLPDSVVIMNQLDSGKPVKGILDKRIVSERVE